MYDFDKVIDRRGINSLKWDVKDNELPMWVADMDFELCSEILDSMKKRLDKPTFGYNIIPNEWYDAYTEWWRDNHGFELKKEWLMFSTGVVPSISSIVRRLTLPGEKVLLQTPVYNIFFNSVYNNGRYIIENPLVYSDGKYSIDFDDLEKKLSEPQTSLMILCNPHNPVGKIWEKETLAKIGDLCYKHNVIVLSDEIHCDLTVPGKKYVPFASVSEICKNISVTCIAPTKCFNMAGLQTSAISVPNELLRHRVYRGINNDEIAEPNSFAVDVTIAAFKNGKTWLDELNEYVYSNRCFVRDFLKRELPMLHLVEGEATYLLWINCENVCEDSVELTEYIRKDTGLYLSDGLEYGMTGKSFLRMNIACPQILLKDGLARLKKAVVDYLDRPLKK